MTERRSYTEELYELKLAVSGVPEMKEDVKELVRALKGNNGTVGVIARLAQVEDTLASNCQDLTEFKKNYQSDRKETKDFFNHKFDEMFAQIQKMNQDRIDKLEEEEDNREQDKRDKGKDWRKFWIGLGLGVVPQLIDWLIHLF
jgi:hypothetical protein